MASCSTRKWQIKSGLSSDTPWETSSICMIYLLRQMKSLSAYSCEKVSMSPPREQMQFVSNLILTKLSLFFPLLAPVAHGSGFKGWTCSLFCRKMANYCHFQTAVKEQHPILCHHNELLWRREREKQNRRRTFVVSKLKFEIISCVINDTNFFF